MSNIFFTSDTHFGHKNIIKYCNRPFSSVEEMNEEMIKRWNEVVKSTDIVHHIGDFAFMPEKQYSELFNRLNGEIHLILGNHDRNFPKALFRSVHNLREIKISDSSLVRGKQSIVLCHYAMKIWNKSHHGAWHLYGHSHGTLPEDINSLSIDVGVDSNNFYPYSYEDIKAIMKTKVFKAVDYHG